MKIFQLIDLIWLLVGERFKGYHIKILSIIGYITGTITFFKEEVIVFLCDTFKYCIDLDSKVMVAIMAINFYLIQKARTLVTTESAPLLSLGKRFKDGYKEEVQKLKLK